MREVKGNIGLFHKTHNIRIGQAVTEYGVGAMVDFIDQTLMSVAPEYWGEANIIHDERLESALGVSEFKMPKGCDEYYLGLPFVRFPEWYFCPRCRRFKPIKDWESEYKAKYKPRKNEIPGAGEMITPRCLECKTDLVPARIVVACQEGHIHDFPWIAWAHKKYGSPICANPQLKIRTGANTAGLEGIKLECVCGARATMAGSFGTGVFERMGEEFKCRGDMPWKGQKEFCDVYPQAVQRGASKVYFPKVESSIVIPPYSDDLTAAIEGCSEFSSYINSLNKAINKGKKDEFLEDYFEDYVESISKQIYREKDKSSVRKVLERKLRIINNEEEREEILTRNVYKEEEYKALIGDLPLSEAVSRDFRIQSIERNKYDIPQISKVVLVHKMREVRALTGFSRLNPPDMNIMSTGDVAGNIKSIKEKSTNWYPAYEVRGEGIFIEFDRNILNEWEEKYPIISNRAKALNDKNAEVNQRLGFSYREITAKFLMLHTIAHLLIRQLSFECGYSAASLRERIYSSDRDADYSMSGTLIYTASGDSEGTMGGLVRQGLPDTLPRIFYNAVQKAKWCSGDPVCIESKGQGRDALNISACHACTLVSETSCEEFNILLDRALIVGTLNEPEVGFFKNLL